jgi:hypothetical protein
MENRVDPAHSRQTGEAFYLKIAKVFRRILVPVTRSFYLDCGVGELLPNPIAIKGSANS